MSSKDIRSQYDAISHKSITFLFFVKFANFSMLIKMSAKIVTYIIWSKMTYNENDRIELLRYTENRKYFYYSLRHNLRLLTNTKDKVLEYGKLLLEEIDRLETDESVIRNSPSIKLVNSHSEENIHYLELSHLARVFTGYVKSMIDFSRASIGAKKHKMGADFIDVETAARFYEEYTKQVKVFSRKTSSIVFNHLRNYTTHIDSLPWSTSTNPEKITEFIFLDQNSLLNSVNLPKNDRTHIESLEKEDLRLKDLVLDYLEGFQTLWSWCLDELEKTYQPEIVKLNELDEEYFIVCSRGVFAKEGPMNEIDFEKYLNLRISIMRKRKGIFSASQLDEYFPEEKRKPKICECGREYT